MFATRTRFVFTLLLAGCWTTTASANEPLEELVSSIFRITDGEHSGTCFFVSGQAANSMNPREAILVTAAHVLAQMSRPKCDLILRVRVEEDQFARKVVPIEIRHDDKPKWTQIQDTDIATMLFELPEEASVNQIPLELISDEQKLKDRIVHVGQEAWIGCYPAKLEANDAGWPVLRRGSVATHPMLPIKSAKTILIDYNVFGGDSGAPIAVIVNDRPLIIGVASAMQRQTDRSTLPFEEKTMHTPLGLSIAVQAPFLRQTIDRMVEEATAAKK